MKRLPVFLLACILAASCGQSLTLEQQIIATIEQMESKIEAGERRAFMTHIADRFSAQNGQMNREQVRALVVFQLNRHKQLQARLLPIRVTSLGEAEAQAEFRALVTGGPGWIPERGQVYDFDTRWILEDDEWLLLSADWEPVPLDQVVPEILREN